MGLRLGSFSFAAALTIGCPALGQTPLAELEGALEDAVLERVRSAVGTAEAAPATLFEARRRSEQARDRAVTALRSEGYYGARVEARAEPGDPPRAYIVIRPGERFVLGAVSIEISENASPAAQAAADQAAAEAGLVSGAPARAADVIAAEASAVVAAEGAGHPDAQALERMVTVDHERGEVDVTLRIDTGREAAFGPLQTTGTARLRSGYVLRLAPFSEGDVYAPGALDTLASRLRGTGAFESVRVRLAESEGPGKGPEARPVIAEVRAGPRHTLSLGATYATSDGGGVDGDWTRRNMFGGAERLTVSAAWRTIDRRLGVELALPHWRRPGRTLRLETAASDEETDAFERFGIEAGARVEAPLTPRAGIALGTGASLSEVDDGDSFERFALVHVSGAINWDGSDDLLDPTRGARASVAVRPTAGVGDEPLGYVVAETTASAYRPVGGERVVAAVRGRLGSIVGPALGELPADERFFAGGGGSVRGFEYQSISPRDADGDLIGGRTVTEASAELRVRGQGRFGYVAFLDGGVASGSLEPDFGDMRWGAGLGVRYYTVVGPMRVDVATPLDRREGEDPVQLYLSIGQAF